VGYTAKVDRQACIAAGACVSDSPKAFGFDEENIAEVLPGAEELSDDRLLLVARACPATAILLYDDEGNEVDIFAEG
jgi:ferredoxin